MSAEHYFPNPSCSINHISNVLSRYVVASWHACIASIEMVSLPDFYSNPSESASHGDLSTLRVRYPSLLGNEAYHPFVLTALSSLIGHDFLPVDHQGNVSADFKPDDMIIKSFRPWL